LQELNRRSESKAAGGRETTACGHSATWEKLLKGHERKKIYLLA